MSLESRRERADRLVADIDEALKRDGDQVIWRYANTLAALRAVWKSRRQLQEQVAQLRLGGREMGRYLVHLNGIALDVTGMHDVIDEDGDGDWGAVWDNVAELGADLRAARARIAELEPERDACRRAAQSWLSVVERQCRDVLDATGMHDFIDESGDGDWALVWERIATMGADLRTAQARVAELEAFVADIACHGLRTDLTPTFMVSSPHQYAEATLRYMRSADRNLRADARKFVPDADRPSNAGRPIPAPKVAFVADPETELGVLLAQDREGGAR